MDEASSESRWASRKLVAPSGVIAKHNLVAKRLILIGNSGAGKSAFVRRSLCCLGATPVHVHPAEAHSPSARTDEVTVYTVVDPMREQEHVTFVDAPGFFSPVDQTRNRTFVAVTQYLSEHGGTPIYVCTADRLTNEGGTLHRKMMRAYTLLARRPIDLVLLSKCPALEPALVAEWTKALYEKAGFVEPRVIPWGNEAQIHFDWLANLSHEDRADFVRKGLEFPHADVLSTVGAMAGDYCIQPGSVMTYEAAHGEQEGTRRSTA